MRKTVRPWRKRSEWIWIQRDPTEWNRSVFPFETSIDLHCRDRIENERNLVRFEWFCLKCKGVLGVFVNQMKEIEVTKITLIVNWPGLRWLFCQTELLITGSGFVFDVGFVEWSTRGINCEVASFYWLCLNSRRVQVKTTTSILLRCAHFSVVSHEAIVVLAFPNFLQLYYFFLGQWYSNQLWDYLLDNI